MDRRNTTFNDNKLWFVKKRTARKKIVKVDGPKANQFSISSDLFVYFLTLMEVSAVY